MRIAEYIHDYTSGRRITLWQVGGEFIELLEAMVHFDGRGVKEEFGDVIHFIQLWCFWRFGRNGEIWRLSRHSVQKFMARKVVWQRLYQAAGLPQGISNYAGNCENPEKVIKQLGRFGISEKLALDAYNKVINGFD